MQGGWTKWTVCLLERQNMDRLPGRKKSESLSSCAQVITAAKKEINAAKIPKAWREPGFPTKRNSPREGVTMIGH